MAMILIRLLGDVLHVFAHFILLRQLFHSKNARANCPDIRSPGISLKTQELLLLVCCTRYIHIFLFKGYSWFNSFFKVSFISVHVATIYLLKRWEPVRETYQREQDDFEHWNKIVIPSLTIAFSIHVVGNGFEDFDHFILLWTFSIILESVALLPQIFMYRRSCGECKKLSTGTYIFLIGAYRFFYCVHCIYSTHCEPQRFRHHWLLYFCGVVQVAIASFGVFWPQPSSLVSPNSHTNPWLKGNHSSHVAIRATLVATHEEDQRTVLADMEVNNTHHRSDFPVKNIGLSFV